MVARASGALRGAGHEAVGRVRSYAWPLAQQAVAATLAWMIAAHVVDHRQPFFAPIAAVIALNAPLGERGGNALRLLEGVVAAERSSPLPGRAPDCWPAMR